MTTITDQHRAGMAHENEVAEPAQTAGQYTLTKILGIWLAGGAPMWILGWLVHPALSRGMPAAEAGLLRMKLLALGLAWQFVLALILLYREEGNLRLGTIRRRFWLNAPLSPKTGRVDQRLWGLLIPLILLVGALEMGLAPIVDGLWTALFPFLAEPHWASVDSLFSPGARAQFVGDWGFLALFVGQAILNTFLGEEFLYRGVLLPKMSGVFGRWDWVANGALFGMYHLHQPWGMLGNILTGLVFAFAARRFRSNWFSIVLHSGQSVYFGFLILGLVLGLA